MSISCAAVQTSFMHFYNFASKGTVLLQPVLKSKRARPEGLRWEMISLHP